MQSMLHWQLQDEQKHASMLGYYKALIQLRKENGVLSRLDRKSLLVHADENNDVLLLSRWSVHEELICVLNFSHQRRSVTLPAGPAWHKIWDSAGVQWNGPTAAAEPIGNSECISYPESISIYKRSNV
jgi:maltooligosyltrehalose trehalohydrolase